MSLPVSSFSTPCFPTPKPTYTHFHFCHSHHPSHGVAPHLTPIPDPPTSSTSTPAYLLTTAAPPIPANFDPTSTCTPKSRNYYHCTSSGCKTYHFRPAWICWSCDGYNPVISQGDSNGPTGNYGDVWRSGNDGCVWCKAKRDGSSVVVWVMDEGEEKGVWGGLKNSWILDEEMWGVGIRVLRRFDERQLGWGGRHEWKVKEEENVEGESEGEEMEIEDRNVEGGSGGGESRWWWAGKTLGATMLSL